MFPREVGPGSTLWVVTRERSSEPYSLVARMKVAEVRQAEEISGWWPPGTRRLFDTWKRVALSEVNDSQFFEANDADADLKRLGIRFYGPFRYLRNPKGAFASSMAQVRRTVFLSYKWVEEREFSLSLASSLRSQGLSPWFDALSIPSYDETRDPTVEQRLGELIRLGIAGSCFAVVLNSPGFAKSGWTKTEWCEILHRGIRCFEVMRGGEPLPHAEPIEDGPPEDIAAAINRATYNPEPRHSLTVRPSE